MTVSTELSHEEYTGNGVTTDFDFRFRIFEAKHLVVSVADPDGTERILTNGTDYTLRGVGSYRGGKVILKMPLATGWKIGIARDLPVVQETDLRNQGKFFAEVHEDAFDYLTMLIQKSLGYLSLCLRKPSFISDHYDAKGNKISNLGKPVIDDDAVDLGTMNEHISAKDKRSLRVADKDIPALPGTAVRRNKQLGFDNNGLPLLLDPAETGALGYVLVDSFEKGAVITSRYQALHWLHNGEYYRWDGALPKTVPAGSTPDSTGGVGIGAWIGVGDASLRAITQYRVNTIAQLKLSSFGIGDFISVSGYYTAGDGANHFRIISAEDDGSGVQIANGLWANIVHSGEVHVSWFGAVSGAEDGAENLPDSSPAITKAFNYYRYNLKFDPAWYRLSSSIPIGSHASFSTSSGNGQQWPINNVYWFVVDSDVTRIWDITLTNDKELRDFKISNFRFSPSTKVNGCVIYNDMPLGPFEISHVHIDNITYFLKNTISDREPSNVGQFLSMGTRINIIDSFIRSDYTMYCDKGAAESLWSNHNNVTRSTISSFHIEAGCQNWKFDSCLYETWDKEMFYSPLRAENLQFISMYIEGVTSSTNTAVSLAEWNEAKASGTLIRTVTDYSSTTPVQYTVYIYNGLWYCGNASGTDISSTSASNYVSLVKVDGPANVSFEHCLFANFQSLFRTTSRFFTSDIFIRDCSFFDNTAKVNTHAPYLFVEAADRLINIYHDSGLSTQKRFSNRPVFLRTPSNIKAPESYNETRASGNATLRAKVKINSPVLYVTTNQANSGRGYSESDPLLVPGNFSDFIKGVEYHSKIVAVDATFTITSLIDIYFPFDMEMRSGSGIYVTASGSLPYINAEKGFRITGGTIRFSGNLTDTTFDYLIGKGYGVYEFTNVSMVNGATKNISLVYNDASHVPIAIRLYNVSTTGTIYASKISLPSQTSFYSVGSGVVVR